MHGDKSGSEGASRGGWAPKVAVLVHKHHMGLDVHKDLKRLQTHPGLKSALKHLDTQYAKFGKLAYQWYL